MLPPLLMPAPPPARVLWRPDADQERLIAHGAATGPARPGACVGLGGPGTGKTSTLVRAAAARLFDGVPVADIRLLAFNRARARDLRTALAAEMQQGALPVVTTFHGLAFDIVGRASVGDPDASPPRLLSGAEEDVRIRDLLRGAVADGQIPWPEDLTAALPTIGLANDVRAFLARVRELGIDTDQLAQAGRTLDRPEWTALAQFARHEADVMALEDLVDYTALLEVAIGLLIAEPSLTGGITHLFVDDFQEADPLQRRLLEALCEQGVVATVCASPDQTAYAFRGADPLGVIRLAERVRAPIVGLGTLHRGVGPVHQAYQRVRRHPALPGLSADVLRTYREPVESPETGPGTVSITRHDSLGDLAAHVARDLRRRHLGLSGEPTPWSDMAVLLPTSRDIDVLRRALEADGVPVRVATDALPLPEEPAVAVLLSALQAAVDPTALGVGAAVDLVMGPLGGVDAVALRALARDLRREYRAVEGTLVAPSGTALIRDLLVGAATGQPAASAGEGPSDPSGEVHDRVIALGRRLSEAHDAIRADAQPAEVLWMLWDAHLDGVEPWPERLRTAALAGHRPSGHDLDAVMALFDAVERLSDRYSGAFGVQGLLAGLTGQRLPGESIAARSGASPAVEILTARLAVGRSWPHVVIVGAQEGEWPRLTVASSSVHADELDLLVDGAADVDTITRERHTAQLAGERRLFSLAVSRATDHCHVAVIEREGEHGDRPSRFVEDLQVPLQSQPGRPARSVTLDGLVAELRSVAEDSDADPDLRDAATRRLAALAAARDDQGDALVPQADPRRWWGLADLTTGLAPVRPPDQPVALSGSGLQSLNECPLRWFLSRAARAEGPSSSAMAFGNIVHVLAERLGAGELPPDPEVLLQYAERIWPEVAFDMPWQGAAELTQLREALERLCHYHRTCSRTVVDTEHGFDVTIPIEGLPADADAAIAIRGSIDRVEIDPDGGVYLVDFKTGKYPPSDVSVRTDAQLGMYQAAALAGAVDEVHDASDLAGAALVQLRKEAGKATPDQPKIQPQPPLDPEDDDWLLDPVRTAVSHIRAEDFPATPNSMCEHCSFRAVCPAQIDGQEVTT